MKRLFYFLILLLGCSSCDSLLDVEPRNGITFEHYFRTEQDLEALVLQMHGTLRASLGQISYHDHMGLKVDVVKENTNFQKVRSLNAAYLVQKSNQEQWKRYYNVLALADLYLDNYKKAQNVSEARLKYYLGQVNFVRAVCYFYLARDWGEAIITKGSMYTDCYAKSSVETVLDTAINTALRAYNLLPKYEGLKDSKNNTLTSKQYGCKGNTAALLAHLYAWKGSVMNREADLVNAETWASKLIEPEFRDEVGVYTLAVNPEEVCTEVMHRKSAESLFELEISYSDATTYPVFLPASYLIGAPVMKNEEKADIRDKNYGMSIPMIEEMYPVGDGRREAYFYKLDDPEWRTEGLAFLYKWRYARYGASQSGESWFVGFDLNKVIFRLADIYLLRAECRVKLGDVAGAKSDLGVIRQRAGAKAWPSENDSGDLQYDIFKEREKELLHEGHRYYDVIRNGYWNTEFDSNFPKLSETEVKDGALYLPVPQTAFSDNDLMIENTYWVSKMK